MTIFNEMNKYPVIFIGSGMSKRYLKEYPNWDELLESYWIQIKQPQNYYSYLNELKKQYTNDFAGDELTHKINTVSAEFIENEFNKLFDNGEIKIPDLTHQKVYREDISPFKYSICLKFSECEIRDDIDQEEYKYFKEFLKKAKIIITTNYDPFIENILKEQGEENVFYNKYIGNKGFFTETIGYSELYKIHGDISDPHSIIINQKDYEQYDANSILISAKILSNIINTQIIFFGYSLTDRNVKKLLKDFSSQFPKEDDRISAKRIIVVQHDNQNSNITPIHSSNFDVSFIEIKTNNYKQIFQEISLINEGLTVPELLRYQKIIKTLIVNQGEKGDLDKILVSPSDIENLEDNLKLGKNLVVAIGDKKLILANIDQQMYIEDYILDSNQISLDEVIKLLIKTPYNAWIPFAKQIQKIKLKNIELAPDIKVKINQRISYAGDLQKIIDGINIDKINEAKTFHSISEIENENFNIFKESQIIIKNINNIPLEDVRSYIQNKGLNELKNQKKPNIKSGMRKLFCAYDLRLNGDIGLL